MRNISGAERDVVKPATAGGYWTHAFLRVTNFDGTWVNLGALAVGDRVLNFPNTLTWGDHVDQNTLSFTAVMKREIGVFSLVPFRSDSPINVDDASAFSPLLDLSRQWEIMAVFTAVGVYPADESDYRPMAAGICTRIDVQGDPATVTVQGNGYEADIIDSLILPPNSYAAADLPDFLQDILDQQFGAGEIPLTVDATAPAFFVNAVERTEDDDPIGAMELLTQTASLPGASLRYLYDDADALTFTLYAPVRNATVPDWEIGGDEYEKLDAGIDRAGIRNYVVVKYADTNFGIQTVTSPVTPTSASITRYGLRTLVINLAASTAINTQVDAGAFADAVRADLEFPVIEQQIVGTGLWFVELGDYVKLRANGVLSNEDQYGGVTAYSHTFANGELVSTISFRGQPAGRYRTWLDFGPGAPRTPFTPEIVQLTATAFEQTFGGSRITGVLAVANVNQYTRSVTFELSATIDFAVVLDTSSVDVTDSRASAIFFGTAPDTIYYVRATPWSGVLVGGVPTGVAGDPVIAPTFINRLTPSQPQFDDLVDTIGDLAGTVGAIGIPTVFVNIEEDDSGTHGLALTTIPTSEVEVGTDLRRQRYLVGAGSVRLNANIKSLTGTPMVKLKYSVNGFGAVADLVTWAPPGTGLRSSAWAALPAGAKADAGLTIYVANGADTAALTLFGLDAEFLPTIVTGGRVHVAAFAAAFN